MTRDVKLFVRISQAAKRRADDYAAAKGISLAAAVNLMLLETPDAEQGKDDLDGS